MRLALPLALLLTTALPERQQGIAAQFPLLKGQIEKPLRRDDLARIASTLH